MNTPITIVCNDFSEAWAKVIKELSSNSWSLWNIVVTIKNPHILNNSALEEINRFSSSHGILNPKKVQHTIFPSQFYEKSHYNRERLYKRYWKYFNYTRKLPHKGWGTYFQRMIAYNVNNNCVDQLGDIIDNINNRTKNYGSSYVIIIPYPDSDHNKKMGAPCLNYVTVQVENDTDSQNGRKISLLAVYRNHDFRERAYGNYLGLCDLLNYICIETNSAMGYLTCISSHAYVSTNRRELKQISEKIIGENNE